MKGLEYRTVFVDFPDIESLCIKLGAKPTGLKRDSSRSPRYTLPIIHDPRHGHEVISDSFAIAEYLNNTYSSTLKSFPSGTKALQAAFIATFEKNVKLWPIMLPATHDNLSVAGQDYYRKTVETFLGRKLEELSPPGPVRDQCWKEVKQWFDVVDGWFQLEEGQYFMGDKISFVDIVLASYLTWIKTMLGEGSDEWKEIISWNNHRWEKLSEAFDPWATVTNL
jgi:glutathione S-transferase